MFTRAFFCNVQFCDNLHNERGGQGSMFFDYAVNGAADKKDRHRL